VKSFVEVVKSEVLVEADGVEVLGGDIEVYAIDALPTECREESLE